MAEPDYQPDKPTFTPLPVYHSVRDYIQGAEPTLHRGRHQAETWQIKSAGQEIADPTARFGRAKRFDAGLAFVARGTTLDIRWRLDEGETSAWRVTRIPLSGGLSRSEAVTFGAEPLIVDEITVYDRSTSRLLSWLALAAAGATCDPRRGIAGAGATVAMNTPRGLMRLSMTHASWRAPLLALILALLLLASALRFHRLGEQSLWYDEGVAYAHSLRTLPELIPLLQRNVHVPAYFTLLGWWQDFTGSSEFALRALSALFSVISVAWAFALGRRLHHPLAGLAAAALVALNSFSIYYAQEARMYAMLTAVAGASMWLVAGLLRGLPPPRRRRLSFVALGLVNALGIYTHVAFALVIAAQIALAGLWLAGNLWLREGRDRGARPATASLG